MTDSIQQNDKQIIETAAMWFSMNQKVNKNIINKNNKIKIAKYKNLTHIFSHKFICENVSVIIL